MDKLLSGDAPPCKQMNVRVSTLEGCVKGLRDKGMSTLKVGKITLTSRHAEIAFIVVVLAIVLMWRDATHGQQREEIKQNLNTLKQMVGGVTMTNGGSDVRVGANP
jgi:hypothetical protein